MRSRGTGAPELGPSFALELGSLIQEVSVAELVGRPKAKIHPLVLIPEKSRPKTQRWQIRGNAG